MAITPDGGYRSSVTVTPSDATVFTETLALGVACTVAGNVSVVLVGGTTLVVPVAVGWVVLPLAVKQVLSTGTTATAVISRLN